MRIGLSTPVLVQLPGVASPWESTAGVEDIVRIARAADDAGFGYLTCSEHVAIPLGGQARRGSVYWDPLASLAFLAAQTSRIKLASSVLVLGYHHPLEIAKRYGTLDRLSAGRLVLGVGVGSLAEEFDLLGAAWRDRGARADDAIRALRASLSDSRPRYRGTFYDYRDVVVDPCAVQPRVPIWVGGRTRRSLRRAITLGDGWMPFGLSAAEISEMLAGVRLPPDFDVLLASRPLAVSDQPDQTRRELRRLREIGATAITCTVAAESAAHFADQLPLLRELASEAEQ